MTLTLLGNLDNGNSTMHKNSHIKEFIHRNDLHIRWGRVRTWHCLEPCTIRVYGTTATTTTTTTTTLLLLLLLILLQLIIITIITKTLLYEETILDKKTSIYLD